jgi:hypothetical protein
MRIYLVIALVVLSAASVDASAGFWSDLLRLCRPTPNPIIANDRPTPSPIIANE